MPWWTCAHPLLLIRFYEEENILKRISLFPPDPSLPSSDHPFVALFSTYLNGNPVLWPSYDESLLTPYQKKVFHYVQQIPYGTVKTYTEIATLVGNPHSSRAIAQALKHNPFPLVIPCHRVVSIRFPHDIGGFTPDPAFKKILLQLEKAL